MEIGGYFSLELNEDENTFHANGFALNTGRNSLEFILRNIYIRKIYIPLFTCEAVLEPINKLGICYEWYEIDEKLQIKSKFEGLNRGEFVLYTNYFGIMDKYIDRLSVGLRNHLIVDNAQSFFSSAISGIPTFYSPRKFLGIPDGGYAFVDVQSSCINEYEIDISYSRCSHLLKRLELPAHEGYEDFKSNSKELSGQPIRRMSLLTKRLLSSTNLKKVQSKRRNNFGYLTDSLQHVNKLKIEINLATSVPLVYPFLTENEKLRSKLIEDKIFVATYWPNVFKWCSEETLEYKLAKFILPIPIDQRYGYAEMDTIISILNDE